MSAGGRGIGPAEDLVPGDQFRWAEDLVPGDQFRWAGAWRTVTQVRRLAGLPKVQIDTACGRAFGGHAGFWLNTAPRAAAS